MKYFVRMNYYNEIFINKIANPHENKKTRSVRAGFKQ